MRSRVFPKYNTASRTLRSYLYFKLFELIIVMLVLSALYSAVMDRLNDIQKHYETAEVNWTIAALKTAASAERTSFLIHKALGKPASAFPIATSPNPMRLLSKLPRNYIGELCNPGIGDVPPGSWHYDRCNHWLAYMFSNEKIFAQEYPKMLRFNVEFFHLLTDTATQP